MSHLSSPEAVGEKPSKGFSPTPPLPTATHLLANTPIPAAGFSPQNRRAPQRNEDLVVQTLVCRRDWRSTHPVGESAEQLEVMMNKADQPADRAGSAGFRLNLLCRKSELHP